MTRNLKALGLAMVAAFALSAVAASAANATELKPAKFTFGVAAGETAKVDGEQIETNNNTFRVGELPPMTCHTATFHGKAVTPGPESTEVIVTPTFKTCHITLLGATKTVTVTENNCHFIFDAKTTQPQGTYAVQTTIDCTGGAPIEIHVYNTSAHEHIPAATLCTFHIGSQGPLNGITATNVAGAPNDILMHINVTGIAAKRTSGSALTCGPENNTFVYTGTGTVRATNAAGAFVSGTIST